MKNQCSLCAMCNLAFENPFKLEIHVTRKHSESKPDKVHTEEKSFSCNFCEKTFGFSCQRKIHERIHTGEKPFKCNFCCQSFAQRGNKVRHEIIHTNEKPFECRFCCQRFALKSNKIRHERIHTNEKTHEWPICPKTFARLESKICHEHIHTGEKPYKCDICQKTFTTNSNKIHHEKIHLKRKKTSKWRIIRLKCALARNSVLKMPHLSWKEELRRFRFREKTLKFLLIRYKKDWIKILILYFNR